MTADNGFVLLYYKQWNNPTKTTRAYVGHGPTCSYFNDAQVFESRKAAEHWARYAPDLWIVLSVEDALRFERTLAAE